MSTTTSAAPAGGETPVVNITVNIMNSTGKERFNKDLFEQSIKDVVEASAEFSKQGLDGDEVVKRTRDALILARLSTLSIEAKDLTDALVARAQPPSDVGVSFGADFSDKLQKQIQEIIKKELIEQSRPGGFFAQKSKHKPIT